jgi:hypothetical protein
MPGAMAARRSEPGAQCPAIELIWADDVVAEELTASGSRFEVSSRNGTCGRD